MIVRTLLGWTYIVISVAMAVDVILARYFAIGESKDSLFVIWCAIGSLYLYYSYKSSAKTGSEASKQPD